MTRFDFDVIGDAPAPRIVQPATAPASPKAPPPEKDVTPADNRLPQSDAA